MTTSPERVVACHQPDLLPYTGFWHKMAKADVMVLLPYDQFQKHGYQRRVLMRGTWVSHQLVGKPSLVPINEVQVLPGWRARLWDSVRGRYATACYFKERGPLFQRALANLALADQPVPLALHEVNAALITMMQPLLGIETPLVWTDPTIRSRGAQRVLDHVRAAGGTTYLSGTGAMAYMPDAAQHFQDAGVALLWSRHQRTTDDSVLTAYFDDDDPLATILREAQS